MQNSTSQASQDLFALLANRFKRNGTFLEIGANHPIIDNNTHLLTKEYNWYGVMVEYNGVFQHLYDAYRPESSYIIADATQIDFNALMEKCEMPHDIDYLQIDLEVNNRSTLTTLENLDKQIFSKYTFATVTFEHDIYTGDFFSTREMSRKIFKDRGYILTFPDVTLYIHGGQKAFEDWYMHPKLIDIDYINKVKRDVSMCHTDIINILRETQI